MVQPLELFWAGCLGVASARALTVIVFLCLFFFVEIKRTRHMGHNPIKITIPHFVSGKKTEKDRQTALKQYESN